ncbi:MAG: hypothetical protein KHX37_08340 [Eubacterium sp.]|nr:hypothetical protein [Eubacterium sp.]
MNKAKKEDYAKLKSGIIKFSREDLTKHFNKYIQEIIIKKWDGNGKLEEYLKGDINDFVVDLKNGAEHNCLEKVVVL